MKYLIGMSLLVCGIAFASPVSYGEKGDSFSQVPCKKKKKKKKKDCGCGHLDYRMEQSRL